MKRTQKLLAVFVASLLPLTACSTTAPPSSVSGPASSEATSVAPGGSTASGTSSADNFAKPSDPNKIYIGIVSAVSGTNKTTGEMAYNGAKLATEELNAAGGILGKQIELIHADEIDNMQASVNATNKLLDDERISVLITTQYSQNILAVLPAILEAKMPSVACGSNNLIADEKNPYVWQPRNHDNRAGIALAEYAYETLGIRKPAFLYSTLPNTMAGGESMINTFKDKYGIETPQSRIFPFPEEEKNFAPIIAQIANSGADGLLCFGNQQPYALISKAIGEASLDIPRLASAAVTSSIVMTNAGKAADGWYSCPDWAPYIDTPIGSAFQQSYKAKFNQDTELSNAVTYDTMYLIKAACENANSTVDREAINAGFAQIKDLEGVMGTFTMQEDHGFLNEMFITHTEDGKAVLIGKVKYR